MEKESHSLNFFCQKDKIILFSKKKKNAPWQLYRNFFEKLLIGYFDYSVNFNVKFRKYLQAKCANYCR